MKLLSKDGLSGSGWDIFPNRLVSGQAPNGGLSKWSKVLSTFEPVSGDWLVVSGDSPITVSSVNKRA